MELPTVKSQSAQPTTGGAARRGAAKRVAQHGPQRYLNKGTGRMEALVRGRFPGKPAGHRVSSTQHTVKREVTPPAREGVSLLQMTPGQIEDRARRIVDSEIKGERLPFQQRGRELTGEEAGVQQAHTQDYGQLETGTTALATKQGEGAKTFQNVAAEAVKRAEGPAPGTAEAAEQLGGKPPEPGSSLARQQEAARTLLTAIATGAQAGTNARQQSETNFLTNLQGTVGMEKAAGTARIASDFGKAKRENADKEAQVTGSRTGRVGKLVTGLEGEQEKLRIASAGLQLKGAEAQRKTVETRANITHRQTSDRLAGRKVALDERSQRAEENYKNASVGSKKRKDELDIKQKEIGIKKALEGHPGHGLTQDKINAYTSEASRAFNFFKRARSENASPAEIRQELEQGQGRRSYQVKNPKTGKSETKHYTEHFSAVKDPVFIQMAEEIMQKEYIGAGTKQRLREMGLPDSEWSNHFLGGPRTKQAAPNIGKRKNY